MGGGDEELLRALDASLLGQFARQWKLRISAQEAAPNEVANCKLRRSLSHNKSFSCMDVTAGNSVLARKASRRESAPGWRGPAEILDIDDAGVTAKFQNQTFKLGAKPVPRHPSDNLKDVGELAWRPASESLGATNGV